MELTSLHMLSCDHMDITITIHTSTTTGRIHNQHVDTQTLLQVVIMQVHFRRTS